MMAIDEKARAEEKRLLEAIHQAARQNMAHIRVVEALDRWNVLDACQYLAQEAGLGVTDGTRAYVAAMNVLHLPTDLPKEPASEDMDEHQQRLRAAFLATPRAGSVT